jgi:hypothetical protein
MPTKCSVEMFEAISEKADQPPGQLATGEKVVLAALLLARSPERDEDDEGQEADEGQNVECGQLHGGCSSKGSLLAFDLEQAVEEVS